MEITKDIKYVGVNDHKIDLFEGQFVVPNGMSYNSYVILDEKIAVMDSVAETFGAEWLENIKSVIGEKKPEYLVIQHMEMDHSNNILAFTQEFPEAKIVATKMAFAIMKCYFGNDFLEKQIIVTDCSKLELGKHILNFVTAPNVHWPEVIMTYESTEKVLFAADGFGKFGANDIEDPEGWDCEARRYYFGIIGKFGTFVQSALKKLADFEIKIICSLHGPVLTENLNYYINLYDIWSSYKPESEGVMIAYTSIYGNTKKTVEKLAELLKSKGCKNVVVADLAREDLHECVEDAFRYEKLILATTTYCGGVFPKMREFIQNLTERNYQNRKVAFVENGAWGPLAAKCMEVLFVDSKNITFAENKVTVKISMNEDTILQLEKLAEEMK